MPDEVLLLDNDDVASILDVDECMAALERAYRAMAGGASVERPRSQIRVPLDEPGVTYCFKSMEGALLGDGYITLRITSDAVFEGRVATSCRADRAARTAGWCWCSAPRILRLLQSFTMA